MIELSKQNQNEALVNLDLLMNFDSMRCLLYLKNFIRLKHLRIEANRDSAFVHLLEVLKEIDLPNDLKSFDLYSNITVDLSTDNINEIKFKNFRALSSLEDFSIRLR